MYHGLLCVLLEVARHESEFVHWVQLCHLVTSMSVPVRLSVQSFFFLCPERLSVSGMGMEGKLAKNATFLNTREKQRELQFLSGITARASAELWGCLLYTSDAADE